jgi:hypothetical protein
MKEYTSSETSERRSRREATSPAIGKVGNAQSALWQVPVFAAWIEGDSVLL